MANVGDKVLGFVEDRGGEAYRIALPGANFGGVLGFLAFDGATRRLRPHLRLGDAVYCRVATTLDGFEPRLTCCSDDVSAAKGWMTDEAHLGKLSRDHTTRVVRCTLQACSKMLAGEYPLLVSLRRHYQHSLKLKVGANGIVWLKTDRSLDTTCVANALLNADRMPHDDTQVVDSMVDHLVASVNASKALNDAAAHPTQA